MTEIPGQLSIGDELELDRWYDEHQAKLDDLEDELYYEDYDDNFEEDEDDEDFDILDHVWVDREDVEPGGYLYRDAGEGVLDGGEAFDHPSLGGADRRASERSPLWEREGPLPTA